MRGLRVSSAGCSDLCSDTEIELSLEELLVIIDLVVREFDRFVDFCGGDDPVITELGCLVVAVVVSVNGFAVVLTYVVEVSGVVVVGVVSVVVSVVEDDVTDFVVTFPGVIVEDVDDIISFLMDVEAAEDVDIVVDKSVNFKVVETRCVVV
jgi:hypothetical protein